MKYLNLFLLPDGAMVTVGPHDTEAAAFAAQQTAETPEGVFYLGVTPFAAALHDFTSPPE